jgi:hypothetical protein
MVAGALTRVRNNQVYNSDIDAATKLKPYSITGGLWANSLSYAGNLTIGGNLTINGTTETLDATNLVIADPLLVLNRNQSGAPTYDVGIVMGRGNSTNTAFIWEEGNKQFQLQYTTETTAGATLGAINNSGYANLQAYGVLLNNATITTTTITTENITNSIIANIKTTGGYIDGTSIGSITPNAGVFTSVTTSAGGQHIGYLTGAIGANTANSGAFTTLNASGVTTLQNNVFVTGNIIPAANVTYDLGNSTARWRSLYLSGSTLYLNTVALKDSAGTMSVYDSTGTNQASLTAASINATVIGNANPAAATFTQGNVNGTLYAATVNAGTIGNAGAAFSGASSTLTGASQAASFTTSGGGQVTGYLTGAVGANTANSGAFTTVTTTGSLTAQGTISAPAVQAGTIGNSGAVFSGATSTLTGASQAASFTTSGGGQVTGYLTGAIGANTANSGAFTSVSASSNVSVFASINTTGNIGAGYFVANTASYSPAYYFANGASITATVTGTYSNSNVGAYLPSYSGNIGNLTTGNLIPLANTTYYLGNSTLYWANAYANNFNAISQLATPKIQFTVGGASILEDNALDLAIIGPYQISIKPASYQYTFNNTGSLTGPGGTFVYPNGAVYGNLVATGAYWSNGVSFASTVTGTYSNANVAGYLPTYSGALTAGSITTVSGGQITGYLTGAVGANVANTGAFTSLTASGLTTVTNTTDSTSTSSGSLVLSGGAGIAKNVFIGGNLTVVGNLAIQGNSTTIGSTDLTVTDSVINLHTYPNLAAWTVNDGRDIGFKLHYFDSTLAGGDNLSFLGRANDTGYLEWYTTGTENASNVFVSGTYGTIKSGEFLAANNTAATSPTTGALRVTGGAGVAGNIYSGGQIFGYLTGAIGANTANTGAFTTLSASGTTTLNGTVNAIGTINAATVQAATIGNSGAAFTGATVNTTGAITGATNITAGAQVIGYLNGAVGANTANTGAFTTITSGTGQFNGTLTAATINAGTIGNIGAALVGSSLNSGTGQINGTLTAVSVNAGTIGNSGATFTGATSTLTSTSQAASFTTSGGGQISGYLTGAIGANTANSGAFTTITSTSTITSQGTITGAGQIIGYFTGAIGANTANAGTFTSLTTTGSGGNISGSGYVVAGNLVANNNVYAATYLYANGVNIMTASVYGNTQVGAYLPTYTGNLTAGNVTTVSGGQHIGYLTGAIGANTANTGAFTTVSASGNLLLTSATTSPLTSTTLGALVITGSGGATVGGNVNVGNYLYVGGQTAYIGSGSTTTTLTNPVILAKGSGSTYTQIGLINSSATGSSDFIAYGDNYPGPGNDHGWVDMGFTGSTFNDSNYTITKANDGYVFASGTSGSYGGNLVLATDSTGSYNDIVFATGGFLTANEKMRFVNSTGTFAIKTGTASTNNTSGALTVTGGAGISGNLNATWVNGSTGVSGNLAVYNFIQPATTGGNLNLNSGGDNTNVAINSYGYSANLVVNGNVAQGYQNLLVTNGITGQVGIKTAPGAIVSGASMQITATDSILIPSGTTGQRPTGAAGMVRYNTQTNQFEFFNAGSSAWSGTGSSFTTVTADSFTGTGSQTDFTLSQSTTTSGTLVAINGVIQIPIVAYSVSGTTLTFTEAPLSTDVIDARSIVTTASVTSLAQANTYVSVADTGGTTANIAIVANNSLRYIGNTNGNYFSGNLNSAGNVAFDGQQFTTYDSIIDLHTYGNLAPWVADDGRDIGLRMHYYSGADKLAFAGLENSTKTFQFLIDATEVSGNVTGTFGNVSVGSLYMANTTQSTSTTTGALIVSGGVGIASNLFVGGNITASNTVAPSANASINLGTASSYWNNVYAVNFLGTSTTAKYADLAECYTSDAEYEPGTVLDFGGECEVTLSTTDASITVAGVVSTNPAYLMNSGLENVTQVQLALTGRVPCKVTGTVRQGQMMVSNGDGTARVETNPVLGSVIGKALENFDGDTGVIEVVVGRL